MIFVSAAALPGEIKNEWAANHIRSTQKQAEVDGC